MSIIHSNEGTLRVKLFSSNTAYTYWLYFIYTRYINASLPTHIGCIVYKQDTSLPSCLYILAVFYIYKIYHCLHAHTYWLYCIYTRYIIAFLLTHIGCIGCMHHTSFVFLIHIACANSTKKITTRKDID